MAEPLPDHARPEAPSHALHVTIVFALASALWILGSDALVARAIDDPWMRTITGILKGWAYVAVAAATIYWLARRSAAGPAGVRTGAARSAGPRQWAIAIAVVCAVAIATGTFVYRQERAEELHRLDLHTRLMATKVDAWIAEREADAAFLRSSVFLADLHRRWMDGDGASRETMRARLEEFRALNGYQGIAISERNGTVVLSVGSLSDEDWDLPEAVRAAVTSDEIAAHVMPAPEGDGFAQVRLVVPMRGDKSGVGPVAVLGVDSAASLGALLGAAPTPREARIVLFEATHAPPRILFSNLEAEDGSIAGQVAAAAGDGRGVDLRAAGRDLVGVTHELRREGLRLMLVGDASVLFEDGLEQAFWAILASALALSAIAALVFAQRQGRERHLESLRADEQRRRMEALELLEAVANAVPDAIFAKDRRGRYTLFSREASRATGQRREDVIGKDDSALFPPAEAAIIQANDSRVMDEGSTITYEETLTTVDGPATYLATKGPLRGPDGAVVGMFGASRDITKRRRMELELRESAAQLRLFIENAPAAIAMLDRDMRYLSVSRRWLEDYRIADHAITGCSHYEVFPDQPARWREIHRRCLEGAVERCAADPFPRADGRVDWLKWEVRPWHDSSGAVGGLIIMSEDITARRTAEEELARHRNLLEELVEERTAMLARTVATLESFSYTISHDLRAPLRAIHGFASMLAEQTQESLDADGKRLLERVIGAAERMNEMLEDIQSYSRAERLELVPSEVDMRALALEVIDELRHAYPRAAVVVGDLPTVRADATMMRQLLANLIGNALKFSSKVDAPRVEVGVSYRDAVPEFHVSDNGAGFDMRYANQLFGIFKRLHKDSEFPGTGLGLAIVKHIIERHGGRVVAESQIDRGTTLRFWLGDGLAPNSGTDSP